MPQLPVELVVDFLWTTTKHCATALWYVIHDPTQPLPPLQGNLPVLSRRVEALVRKARSPSFAASLQSVRFLSVKDSFYNPAPWVHRLPLLLGHALSALDSLEVRFVNWAAVPLHPSTLSLGFSQFRLVTRLEHWCRFRNAKQLWHLICAFPRLHTLYVTEQPSSRAQARSFRHQASGRLPLLADVSFGGDVSLASLFCTWLAQMEPRPPLRALTCWPEVQFAEELGTLLREFGQTLECLTLYLDELDVTASDLDVFNVHHCTALHTLKVWNLNSCIAVLQILRVISPASRIQTLFLHTLSPSHDTNEDDNNAYDGGEGTLEEWETAEQLLSHERFCELRRVTLVVDDELSVAEQRFVRNFIDHLRGREIYVEASIHAEGGLLRSCYYKKEMQCMTLKVRSEGLSPTIY
ncbi:hypothetical protein SCP_1900330 [Sparassis crispa]|uniref:F-box domain-containing protein n=1 Tax=Sparassis crispa TaxID=139825 RepID=A0A401H6Y6_9APHY|nr:hypothetical protein SCP_1900330 [Sparassis crispa]GBE90184.1 hypothetical protein SCP_1900330 [Sparassis crispa]